MALVNKAQTWALRRSRMPRTRRLAAVLLFVMTTGCATSPPRPPSVDVSGTWQGTVLFQGGGDRSVEMTLRQDGAKVAGYYSQSGSGSGQIEGGVNGNVFSYTRPGYSLASGDLVVDGDEMTGIGFGTIGLRGTYHLRRQR